MTYFSFTPTVQVFYVQHLNSHCPCPLLTPASRLLNQSERLAQFLLKQLALAFVCAELSPSLWFGFQV